MSVNLQLANRRMFVAALAAGSRIKAAEPVLRPVISEDNCPIGSAAPAAKDGHKGLALIRKPPGKGPFPAVVIVHGGLASWTPEHLKNYAPNAALPSRFLAAGYVTVPITYRSRHIDPQSKDCLADCLAALDHVKRLPAVDPKSVVVYGCSGGGDLALQMAASTELSAIAPEEPASVLLTGAYNNSLPKSGDRYVPLDGVFLSENPKSHYTPERQSRTRSLLARLGCPILMIQGDIQKINHFNAQVLIPELQAVGKKPEVITYPGEPHCFCFAGSGPQTPRPEVALKAFHDVAAFFARHLPTKPRPIGTSALKLVPIAPM